MRCTPTARRAATSRCGPNGSKCPSSFNNDEMAVMGGIGLNIRHFFLDFRVQGYPRSRIWNTFVSEGVTQRVKVSRDLVYGGSIGFFF